MDANLIIAPPSQVRQPLFCGAGQFYGVVINNRWLEITCRNKRCRRDGVLCVHIWDLQFGGMSTEYRPIDQHGA